MSIQSNFARPIRLFAAVFGLFLFGFFLLEGWFYYIKPSAAGKDLLIESSLDKAVRTFQNTQTELVQQSKELSEELKNLAQSRRSQNTLYRAIQNYEMFWGVSLFRDSLQYVWDGYSLNRYPDKNFPYKQDIYINVEKRNNVTILLCRIPFSVADTNGTVPYDLFTSVRLEQKNALPIGKSREYHLFRDQKKPASYPIDMAFFNPLPSSAVASKSLLSVHNDSIGVAYAREGKFESTIQEWNTKIWFWRSILAISFFLVLGAILYLFLDNRKSWRASSIQLILVGLVWIFFHFLSIHDRWLLYFSEPVTASDQVMSSFLINSLFALITAVTVARGFKKLRQPEEPSSYFRTLIVSFSYGLLSIFIISAAFFYLYDILTQIDVTLFDLQIIPSLSTLLTYLSVGILLLAVGYGLFMVGLYLIRMEGEQYKIFVAISISAFIIGLLLAQIYLPSELTLNWAFWNSIAFFASVLFLTVLRFRFLSLFSSLSPLRIVAMTSLAISLFGIPILYNVHLEEQKESLLKNVRAYSNESDPFARNLTERILNSLEQEFKGITDHELINRVPFVQSRFTQTIEQTIPPEGHSYSFNLQLIRPSGDLVVDYSTDLNSPKWTAVFDLNYLSAATELERITKNTIRPIVQLPELENDEDFETFYRGWIPIFSSESDEQIAWILCSIYKERPDFNKPLRAVLASITYEDWKDSYLLLDYRAGRLRQSVKRGITGHFPKYNLLQQAELRAVEEDSVIFYTSSNENRLYRNLLVGYSDSRIIKAVTIVPDLKNILFSFFRFSFTLLITGLFVVLILFPIAYTREKMWNQQERFEHRILDSLLLATLVFLGLIIATTHYAINKQNEEIVRQELLNKLQEVADATERNPRFHQSLTSDVDFSLDSLATPLNVDATFYKNHQFKESTTPQIYQQHLLPDVLPFDVYENLYNRQKREAVNSVNLASQNLLIGYHSLLSPEDKPVAALAVPTFVQSPKYDQQLLETVSYLIIFYLAVFGVFILGTTLISKQLTRPLRFIQRGLNKISKGDLDTTIPVKSNDEIGALVQAYNEMVSRLKEVREELAIAEREAAWKEMAQQVAHEIKNPLTPMKLNVQHLERQLSGNDQNPEELKEKIQKITHNLIEQIQNLNQIASDFSKFSKPIDSEFSKTDVNKIVCSVVDLYETDQNTTFQTDLTEFPIYVNGTADELRRVFINLIKNAFEAMPEGGTISIKSHIQNSHAFFNIEDTGVGISEENKSKIFVPNFSTKSSGTGLGLAICKKIIEAHDGTISFASVKGKGTTFIIKLPLFKS